MLLQQETYEDDNGHKVAAKDIYSVAAFVYIADGFFRWTCPNVHCQDRINSGRAFKVNGTVHSCDSCKNRALLLRTDCDEVASVVSRTVVLQEEVASLQRQVDLLLKKVTATRGAIDAFAIEIKSTKI